MENREMEFYKSLVGGYFNGFYASLSLINDPSIYCESNIKYHTQDPNWLRGYVFNRAYSDFGGQPQSIFNIHDFVTTKEFSKIVTDYQNRVIDGYAKELLFKAGNDRQSRVQLKNAEEFIDLVAVYLKKHLNIDESTSRDRLNKSKDNIIKYFESRAYGQALKLQSCEKC